MIFECLERSERPRSSVIPQPGGLHATPDRASVSVEETLYFIRRMHPPLYRANVFVGLDVLMSTALENPRSKHSNINREMITQ
jgi:hypothetical protein